MKECKLFVLSLILFPLLSGCLPSGLSGVGLPEGSNHSINTRADVQIAGQRHNEVSTGLHQTLRDAQSAIGTQHTQKAQIINDHQVSDHVWYYYVIIGCIALGFGILFVVTMIIVSLLTPSWETRKQLAKEKRENE